MKWHERFLSTEWRSLLVVTYAAPKEPLLPYLPDGTELDLWRGKALISIVAFRFEYTKFLGIRTPLWGRFSQVNLRFYVRRDDGVQMRRGVVFIKELCPFAIVSETARLLYHENYSTEPTALFRDGDTIRYTFGNGSEISALSSSALERPRRGTLDEFIIERYFGYCRKRNGGTLEFRIEHPPWECSPVESCALAIDGRRLYGDALGAVLECDPLSVLVAAGSAVDVSMPKGLTADYDSETVGFI